jgi:hypothetical protein
VGDITKGKATPVSVYIPRDDIIYNTHKKMYTESIKNKQMKNLNNASYLLDRTARVENLVSQY